MTEGLSQAEVDSNLPVIHVQRKIKQFLEVDIDKLFPLDQYNRFIAHPILPPLEGQENQLPSKRFFEFTDIPLKPRTVVAIGPESGWQMEEISSFYSKKFHVVNLGDRILRTDTAVSDHKYLYLYKLQLTISSVGAIHSFDSS
jgi:16S rRNA U1498 N3-methylase RsmE